MVGQTASDHNSASLASDSGELHMDNDGKNRSQYLNFYLYNISLHQSQGVHTI